MWLLVADKSVAQDRRLELEESVSDLDQRGRSRKLSASNLYPRSSSLFRTTTYLLIYLSIYISWVRCFPTSFSWTSKVRMKEPRNSMYVCLMIPTNLAWLPQTRKKKEKRKRRSSITEQGVYIRLTRQKTSGWDIEDWNSIRVSESRPSQGQAGT